jgi:NAD(P)H dehydrogenase (quinone)
MIVQDMNVLVVFSSRTGRTERLALAAAVGAVQARANIRLRWLREEADGQTMEGVPGWKENRERMEKEYIAPREIDATWADAMIVATNGAPPELKDYLGLLDALRAAGKLGGKVAGACSESGPDCVSLSVSLEQLGLVVVPAGSNSDLLENARLQGRRVTEVARSLKESGESQK